MRFKLISCEIFYREMCAVVARSPHQVDMAFLPKGLHDIGSEGMRAKLEEAIGQVDESAYDAILLGYGLCNNGLVGLRTSSIPLVLPRAHDCITLFLGNKERYQKYFKEHPGVYYQTTGWIERGDDRGELRQQSISTVHGLNSTYAEMVEKYGEDNAKYLIEQLGDSVRHYCQCTYIEMGVEPDGRFECHARELAEKHGWQFEKIQGDLSLMERLVAGDWPEDEFLVVPPGAAIAATYQDDVICIDPPTPQP